MLIGVYVLLYAMAYIAVVVVPVIVALMLAALLQPGAASLVRRGWPRSLAAFAMLLVGLAVVAGIITLVVERFNAGFYDLAAQVSEGIGQVQTFVVRTFPITQGQLEDAVGQLQETLVDNQDTIASGALTTAATVGEVITGIVLALFTLFFFLKDGRTIWLWLVGLFPRRLPRLRRRGRPPLVAHADLLRAGHRRRRPGRRDRHRHRPGDPRRAAGHPPGRAGLPRRVHPDHRWLPRRHGRRPGGAGVRGPDHRADHVRHRRRASCSSRATSCSRCCSAAPSACTRWPSSSPSPPAC